MVAITQHNPMTNWKAARNLEISSNGSRIAEKISRAPGGYSHAKPE